MVDAVLRAVVVALTVNVVFMMLVLALSVNVMFMMILMNMSGGVECFYDVYDDFDECEWWR